MKTLQSPRQNLLLNSLSEFELTQIIPLLEAVSICTAEVIVEMHDEFQYLFFPTTACFSLINCLSDGTTVEVAQVGSEGLLGATAILGSKKSLTQVIVNKEGDAYRISLASLQKIIARGGGRRSNMLQKSILRYLEMLITHTSQGCACNRRHSLEQQLARWLLSSFDRVESKTLSLTQETIAYYLGVRRESVTEAAKKLQKENFIKYQRGQIELTNRYEMENKACECYEILKTEQINLTTEVQAA
ncbi:Crp/Fnr family transcriptional regulator [Nitrosomonas ureae]|nr:Crp/Fnr family transcriptional regulator [Nitrosomonas ureae]